MGKRWRWMPTDAQALDELVRVAGVSPIVAHLLLSRGLRDPAHVSAFLDPKLTDLRDPESLPGNAQAATVIHRAVVEKKPIVIYGDYDADGMTATAILVNCLKKLDADVTYYVPNRLEDGYGLSAEAIRKLAERGKKLIITVDCGISAVNEARICHDLGVELVITDHHAVGETLPHAEAIVHPQLGNYPFHGLCGAGVAFKVAWAVCQRNCDSSKVTPDLRDFLLQALGLAAIGTITDVVPLLDENRAIVKHGLQSLFQRPSIGINELLTLTKLKQKSSLHSEDVAFTIGPRLNAAGRLGQAQLAVELLTTSDATRGEALAVYLEKLNKDRDSLERSVQIAAAKQAKEQFDPSNDMALVLAAPGWHAGVIGIVAGRIAEKYRRPTIVIALDPLGQKPGIGSARSAGVVDLNATLLACRELLVSCGGHAQAAGLKIEESKLPIFRQTFCEVVAERIGGKIPESEIVIDAQTYFHQLDLATMAQLEKMAPFGSQNPRPLFGATGVTLAESPKTMGNDRHLSARFVQQGKAFRGVAFGQGEWVKPMSEHSGPMDIAFRPVVNEFNGMRRVELQLTDWRASETPVSEPHFASRTVSSSAS
jgi:single-stranded-DNA-specific exonuclease